MYSKAWYQANKDKAKAKMKAYYEANKDAHKANAKAYYESHKDDVKAKMKEYYESHKESHKANMKAYYQAHKQEFKEYMKSDVNSLGETKDSIRLKSRRILKQMHLHIPGYQIHHCFGYEDPSRFIYCSKSLHLKIHKFLRDNNIDAGSDHWMAIRDMVNDTDEFWYIRA